jgi:hypothetical protein
MRLVEGKTSTWLPASLHDFEERSVFPLEYMLEKNIKYRFIVVNRNTEQRFQFRQDISFRLRHKKIKNLFAMINS